MKLSISTTLFYGNHIFDVLSKLKGSSFDGIELRLKETHFDYNEDSEIKELKKRAKKGKVNILSLHAPSGIDIASMDEWERVRSIREVEKTIVIANRLGAGYVVIHPGEEKGKEKKKMLKESLVEIMEFSKDWGILILIENTQPGKIGDNPAELKEIIDWTDRKVRFCLDTSHLNLLGIKMSAGMKSLGKDIKQIHISDNSGKKDDHLLPYEGCIDWEDFLFGLRILHFNGILCFELMAKQNYTTVLERIKETYQDWKKKFQKSYV